MLASAFDLRGANIVLRPSLDNSIYSESDASNALGGLFAGRTNTGNIRRALLEFDIAAVIPAGSIIDSVSLSLAQTKIGPAGVAIFDLHPVLTGWGEGTSFGTGSGGFATPGDATWNFARFSSTPWTSAGGDFGSLSGSAQFVTLNGIYTFDSTTELVADVQRWLNTPASNFGWILKAADESPGLTTARQLGSREGSPAEQPELTVNYTVVPEPGVAGLIAIVALGASARRRRNRRVVSGE